MDRPHIALASDRKIVRDRLFIELEQDGFAVYRAANAMDLALLLDQHARGERRIDVAVVTPERGDGTLGLAELAALDFRARGVPLVFVTAEAALDAGQLAELGVIGTVDPTADDARAVLVATIRRALGERE